MTKKNPVGRPTKYRKHYCELAEYILSQDKPMCSVAASLGTCEETLRIWKDEHPEFSAACRRGRSAGKELFMEKMKAAAWSPMPVNNTLITLFAINCYDMKTNKTEAKDELNVKGKLSVADAVRRKHDRK